MIKIKIREAERTSGPQAAFVSFPYNTDILGIIKNNFSVKYWNPATKEWELPFKFLDRLVEVLCEYEMEITADNAAILQPPKLQKYEYVYKTQPYSYQVDGFTYGMSHDKWLLGDEQGLGKTKQVIDIACAKKLERGYKHCLIICGINGLKWNWVNEVHTHSDEDAWIIGQRTKRTGKLTIGSSQDKYNQLCDLYNNEGEISNSYFIITNVESLRNENIQQALCECCKAGIIGMIAADEVHKMKNPQSQQGKAFLKVAADSMVAMTGTPLMNTPLDLYIILRWLGYEDHSFYAFKNHYAIMGGYGNYQVVGYQHLEELQTQLDGIMLRRLKDDVLDLPEKTYVDEFVEMTAKQEQIYNEVFADIQMNIDKVKMAPNPLSEMIRLRQATGYTGILSSAIAESAKLDRMKEIVEDSIANGRKVVIFSNWTQLTDAVFARLMNAETHPYDIGLITGETKDEDRQLIVNRFQTDEHCKVLIGTIGAMGTGLTLTAGTVEIFMDHPWNRALYDQAVDRCHRVGQTNNITIYNLLCKDTIDERIWELVNNKGKMADVLVDGVDTSDKGALVDYLMS